MVIKYKKLYIFFSTKTLQTAPCKFHQHNLRSNKPVTIVECTQILPFLNNIFKHSFGGFMLLNPYPAKVESMVSS